MEKRLGPKLRKARERKGMEAAGLEIMLHWPKGLLHLAECNSVRLRPEQFKEAMRVIKYGWRAVY